MTTKQKIDQTFKARELFCSTDDLKEMFKVEEPSMDITRAQIEQSTIEQARDLNRKTYLGHINIEMHDEIIRDRNKMANLYEQHIKEQGD